MYASHTCMPAGTGNSGVIPAAHDKTYRSWLEKPNMLFLLPLCCRRPCQHLSWVPIPEAHRTGRMTQGWGDPGSGGHLSGCQSSSPAWYRISFGWLLNLLPKLGFPSMVLRNPQFFRLSSLLTWCHTALLAQILMCILPSFIYFLASIFQASGFFCSCSVAVNPS